MFVKKSLYFSAIGILIAGCYTQDVVKRSDEDAKLCGNDHPKVGQTAELNTLAHQVSGTARIINNCTIEIENFTYDGGGVDVRVLASKDDKFNGSEDTYLTNDIVGMSQKNGKLTIVLPDNVSLDDINGISIWCVRFGVSFGGGMFT